jgi:hypothetical protein
MCRNRLNTPFVRTWLQIALVLLAGSILLPRLFHPAGNTAQAWVDFLRGVMLGSALALEFKVLRTCKNGPSGS